MENNLNGKQLRNKILEIISQKWPTHVTEVAKELGIWTEDPKKQKGVISKIKYHFDQLAREDLIKVKKIDRALVAWPAEVEKYRLIHEILKV